MLTVQILEANDIIEPEDWCRPLSIISMSGGHSDYYSFSNTYSGTPDNNVKWVKVKYIFGKIWHGKTVAEIDKGPGRFTKYEFVRGNVPAKHILNLKSYNLIDHTKNDSAF